MDDLATFVQDLAAKWSQYLAGIVVLGTFVMAVLQTVKDLTPVREWFHRWFVGKWLKRRSGTAAVASAAQADLVALATDGDEGAFYSLATEQLCGQVSAAAQMVLEDPGSHKELLQCLTAKTPDAAINRLKQQAQPLTQTFAMARADGSPAAAEAAQKLAEAKARTLHQVQRSIDALQISALYRWKVIFQAASFGLCVVVAWAASPNTVGLGRKVFLGVLAGFLAPIARDLQARLQQVK